MASGTIKGTKTGSFGVEIDWVATPNSPSENSSTVVDKVYITYQTIHIGARTVTSTIDGESASFTAAAVNDYPNVTTRRLVATHTRVVPHNTDGTKTNVVLSASFAFNLTSSVHGYIGTLSASGTVNFDTIARVSSFSLSTMTPTTGTSFDATITRSDSTFRNKFEFLMNGVQKALTDYFTSTTYSYTIPHNWIPSSNSADVVVRLYTYTSTGTTPLGYTEKTISANVLSTLMPTVSMTATISSGGLNGYYVQNKSIAKLVATATASSGSAIKSYVFTGPNVNSSTSADSISVASTATSYTLNTSVIKSPNNLTYYVTVYDTRDRCATYSVNITVYPYVTPEIASVSIQRCNANGVLSKDGTYVKYTINSKFSPILVGTNINNWRTVTICYSTNGGTSYSAATELQAKTTTDTTTSGIYGAGAIATTSAYKFKIVISDSYGASDTKYVDLGSIERPVNVAKHGNGIAFGGISSVTSPTAPGLFECNWDAKFTGDVDVTGAVRPTTPLAIANGGTGATTQKGARDNIGLGYLSNNILDISQCLLENCTYSNGVITSAINSKYYLSLNTTALNDLVMNNKGNKLTLSVASGVANKTINIVIYGAFSDGSAYAQAISANGARTTTLTIPTTLTRVDSVSIQLNRLATTTFTDTSTKFTNIQLELGASATTYNPPLQPLVATSSYSVLFTFGGTEFGMRLTKYGKVVVCNVYRNTISTAQTLSNAYVLVTIPSEFKPAPNVLTPTESPQSPLLLRGDYGASVIGSMFLVDASYVKMFANSPITLSAGVVVAGQLTWITA